MSDPAISPSAPSAAPVRATGFGRLARVITRRTTDLLAIAVVAAGLLAVAGKLTRWWSADAQSLLPQMREAGSTEWGAGGRAVSLDFGDLPYTLRRQTVQGDVREAGNRLLDACRTITAAASPPPHEPAPPEQNLLDALRTLEPVESHPEQGRLYRLDDPLPMVLGTRAFSGSGNAKDAARESSTSRVVCWGRAFPLGDTHWTLLLFHAPSRAAATDPVLELPLPPGARRTHSIREEAGVAWIGIEGEGEPQDWHAHFQESLPPRGWHAPQGWSQEGAGWSIRYRRADGSSGSVEIRFTTAVEGTLSGIVSITP